MSGPTASRSSRQHCAIPIDAHKVSVARIALAWLLQRDTVTSVIVGARPPERLNDNLVAVDIELSDEEIRRLDAVSALPPEYPGWMISRQNAERPACKRL